MTERFDLLVVGGGPSAYVAAIRAAQLGKRVALVEKERPGGAHLNWGCVPSKTMLRSAEVLETVLHSADYGVLSNNVRLDNSTVLKRKDRIGKGLTDRAGSLLNANKVTAFRGHARFTGPASIDFVPTREFPLGPGGPTDGAPPGEGSPIAVLETAQSRRALARSSKFNARPLRIAEWTVLLRDAGLQMDTACIAAMGLLHVRRGLSDEGAGGAERITWNLLRQYGARRRVLDMRRTLRRYRLSLIAMLVVAHLPNEEE